MFSCLPEWLQHILQFIFLGLITEKIILYGPSFLEKCSEYKTESENLLDVEFFSIQDEANSGCLTLTKKGRCKVRCKGHMKPDYVQDSRQYRAALSKLSPYDDGFESMLEKYAHMHLCRLHDNKVDMLVTRWKKELRDKFDTDCRVEKRNNCPGAYSTPSSPLESRSPEEQLIQNPDAQPRRLPEAWVDRFGIPPSDMDTLFEPYESHGELKDSQIIDAITNQLRDAERHHGYMYIFQESRYSDYLKIGYTTQAGISRVIQWKKRCGFEITFRWSKDVKYAKRVESLAHLSLHRFRHRYFGCKDDPDTTCRQSHCEWFKINATTAQKVVEYWGNWMNENVPYTRNGRIHNSYIIGLHKRSFQTELNAVLTSQLNTSEETSIIRRDMETEASRADVQVFESGHGRTESVQTVITATPEHLEHIQEQVNAQGQPQASSSLENPPQLRLETTTNSQQMQSAAVVPTTDPTNPTVGLTTTTTTTTTTTNVETQSTRVAESRNMESTFFPDDDTQTDAKPDEDVKLPDGQPLQFIHYNPLGLTAAAAAAGRRRKSSTPEASHSEPGVQRRGKKKRPTDALQHALTSGSLSPDDFDSRGSSPASRRRSSRSVSKMEIDTP